MSKWQSEGGEKGQAQPHQDANNNFKLMIKVQYHPQFKKLIDSKNMIVVWADEDKKTKIIKDPIMVSFYWREGKNIPEGFIGIGHAFVINFHQKRSEFMSELSEIFDLTEQDILRMR